MFHCHVEVVLGSFKSIEDLVGVVFLSQAMDGGGGGDFDPLVAIRILISPRNM